MLFWWVKHRRLTQTVQSANFLSELSALQLFLFTYPELMHRLSFSLSYEVLAVLLVAVILFLPVCLLRHCLVPVSLSPLLGSHGASLVLIAISRGKSPIGTTQSCTPPTALSPFPITRIQDLLYDERTHQTVVQACSGIITTHTLVYVFNREKKRENRRSSQFVFIWKWFFSGL